MWNGLSLPQDSNVTDFLRDGDTVQVQKAQGDTTMTAVDDSSAATAAAQQNMTSLLTCAEDGVEGARASGNGVQPPSNMDAPATAADAAPAAPPIALPLLPLDAAPPLAAPPPSMADPIMAYQFSQLPPEILNMASMVMTTAPADPAALAALQHVIAEHLNQQAAQRMQAPPLALAEAALPLAPAAAGDQAVAPIPGDGAAAGVSVAANNQQAAGADAQDGGERDAKRIRLDDGAAGSAPQFAAGGAAGQVDAAAGSAAAVELAAVASAAAGSSQALPVQASTDQQLAPPFNMLQGASPGMLAGMPPDLNLAFLESMKFLNQHMHNGGATGDGTSAEAIQQNAAAAAAFEAHMGLLAANAQAAGLVGYDGTPLMLPPLLPLAGVEGGSAAGGGGGGDGAAAGAPDGAAAAQGAADLTQNYMQMLLTARMPGLEQLAAAAVAAQMAEGSGGLPGMLAALAAGAPVAAPPAPNSETSEDDGAGGRRIIKRPVGRPPKNRQPTAAAAAAAASAAAAGNLLQAQGLGPGAAATAAALAGLPPGFPHLGLYSAGMYGLLAEGGFDPTALMNGANLQSLLQPGALGVVGAPPGSGSAHRHLGKLGSSVRQAGGGLRTTGESGEGGGGSTAAGEGDGGSGDDDKRISGEAGKASRITVARLKEVYHLNIEEAAKELGIGMTKLKEHCRQLGIPRWPSRKLRSMDKLIESLHEQAERDPASAQMVDEVIGELQHFKDMIYEDPSVEVEEHIKRLRQSNFKKEYQQRQSTKVGARGSGDDETGGAAPKPRHASTARQNASAAAAIADAHAASTAAAHAAHVQDQANAAAVAMFTAMGGAMGGGFPDLASMMAQMTPDNALSLAQLMQSQAVAMGGLGLPPVPPLVATGLPEGMNVGGLELVTPEQLQQQVAAAELMMAAEAAMVPPIAEQQDIPPVVPLSVEGDGGPLPAAAVVEEVGPAAE